MLSYDAEGRLASVSGISGLVVSQTYGADGLRTSYSVTPVGATVPLTNEQFLYSGGQLTQMVLTTNGTLAYTDTYVYGPSGAPLELQRTLPSGSVSRYWYLLDGRGSVTPHTKMQNGTSSLVRRCVGRGYARLMPRGRQRRAERGTCRRLLPVQRWCDAATTAGTDGAAGVPTHAGV